MPKGEINLAFYLFPRDHDLADFRQVAERINALDRRIATFLGDTTRPASMGWLSLRLVSRPTLSIELGRVRRLPPLRGRRLRHRSSGGKLRQYQLLTAAGIAVPRCVAITPGLVLDPAEWGRSVVVKPDLGRMGASVSLRSVADVTYEAPETLATDHPGRRGGMIAQQFIDTGPLPTAYRVMSYFGRSLSCFREGWFDRPPLAVSDRFSESAGRPIVASAEGSRISLVDDADVLALAARVHAVTPDIPVLGIDIIRDAQSGNLFVLETNPSGNSWTFGGATGREIERDNGLDLRAQFNALDIIAERSAELVLRLAR